MDRYVRASPQARTHDILGCAMGDQRVAGGAEAVELKNIFY